MKVYEQGFIGMDFKPRRNSRIRRNRFKQHYSRWVFSALFALISLGIILVGIR